MMLDDQELIHQFETGKLPHKQLTHEAHVRVAYWYASRNTLVDAIDAMRVNTQRYIGATDHEHALTLGYHETITVAFMRIIHHANAMTGPHESSLVFCDRHPELLTKFAVNRYYSAEVIASDEAKREFVAPDIEDLP